METNKENLQRPIFTKIPVPIAPLPPIPIHLMNITLRKPLNTINSTNQTAISSRVPIQVTKSKTKYTKKKYVSEIDHLKYVTKRVKHEKSINQNEKENLIQNDINSKRDLSILVNQKNLDDSSSKHDEAFIVVSSDEGENEANVKVEDVNVPERFQPVIFTPIENKIIKNIKKSLKRPHSRELLGVLSTSEREKTALDKAKRRLSYSVEKAIPSPDFWQKAYSEYLDRVYAKDIFEYLLESERKPLGVPSVESITRGCVINWLIKINGPAGDPADIQVALWFMDSMFNQVQVPLDKIQLLGAACYWIAQKHNGKGVIANKMVALSKNAFCAHNLAAIEKEVLKKLNFTRPVIPQEFITYLAWWCDPDYPGEIEKAATFICMAGLLVDKSLCLEYPSVIAVAAVTTALTLLNKFGQNLEDRLRDCFIYKAAITKASSQPLTLILRRSVLTLNSFIYEYDELLKQYSLPPYCIAQKISTAAIQFSKMDTRDTRKPSISYKH